MPPATGDANLRETVSRYPMSRLISYRATRRRQICPTQQICPLASTRKPLPHSRLWLCPSRQFPVFTGYAVGAWSQPIYIRGARWMWFLTSIFRICLFWTVSQSPGLWRSHQFLDRLQETVTFARSGLLPLSNLPVQELINRLRR